jgi:ubiquinone biosynthesis accessory factor UbiJ
LNTVAVDPYSRTASPLERIINKALALDEQTREALLKFAGSVVAVVLLNTRQTFYLQITRSGIVMDAPDPVDVDVTIRGTPTQLLAYFMAMQRDEPGRAGTIEITGNIALAQKLIGIVKNIEPDWEEKLSAWTGDSVAHTGGNLLRKTIKLAAHARDTLRQNVSEYLRYESGIVAERAEVNEFIRSVDTLRNDVERLKLRLTRLQSKAGEK